MNKRGISLQLFILLVGICVGVLFGTGIKAMILPSEDNLAISTVEQIFCKTTDNGSDCRLFFAFTFIVSLFIGLLVFVGEHNRIGNWVFGVWLYIIGWVIGSAFIYIFI